MITRLKCLGYWFALGIILGTPIDMASSAYAQSPAKFLDWSIETSKEVFYPGEPILLTLSINNKGDQEQEIYFGGDGIGAFSFEIFDSNSTIIAEGKKIERYGISSFVSTRVPPSTTVKKSVVLNRWCSTLLAPQQYHVVCNVGYRLFSEFGGNKGGPLHDIKLRLDIEIAELDNPKFKKILQGLIEQESRISALTPKTNDRTEIREWSYAKRIAREMIVFTESTIAIPDQLRILRTEQNMRLKWDVIDSLVRSKTLDAGKGLVEAVEDPSMEDVKRELIDAVYKLRETGKPDIIKATDGFVLKYKRPVLTKPID